MPIQDNDAVGVGGAGGRSGAVECAPRREQHVMRHDFFPDQEAQMLSWGRNFVQRTLPNPESFGLSPAIAAQFAALVEAFAVARQVALAPISRTHVAVREKNEARKAMESMARRVARLVGAAEGVSDTDKIQLGLKLPNRGPRALSVVGQAVTIRLTDSDGIRKRRRPPGAALAMIFTFVGDRPPTELIDYDFARNATERTVNVTFPRIHPSGTKVWIIAAWTNPRGELSPLGHPVHTHLMGGVAMLPSAMTKAA